MSASDNSSNEQDTSASPDLVFSLLFQFWLYLISNILSLSCCLFVLYSILSDRALRHSLSNHVIIVLLFICLIYESTDIPFILHYYLYGTVLSTAPAFSRFWSFLDFGCFSTQLIILAWATIERHILIFHTRWVSTKKKRIYVHYLPLITLLLYCFLFYSIIILGPFCENTFDQRALNGVPFPCIYETPFFAQWEILCNESIPALIIILASLGLFLRVIWQRTCRLHRAVNWRKQRKMTIELLSISVLYLSLSVPGTFLVLSYEFGVSPDIGSHFLPYSTFFSYYIVFLFPYVASSRLCVKSVSRSAWEAWDAVTIIPCLTKDRLSIHLLHRQACLNSQIMYTDPFKNLQVLTRYAHLQRGKCCGSQCRHCPYGHINVELNLTRPRKIFNTSFYE